MERAAIFLFYDPRGRVDAYVTHLLASLRPHVAHLLVVSNGPLETAGEEALRPVADDLLIRDNTGYDVGGYRAGLEHLGRERAEHLDELLLLNHTFFGPVHPWQPLFDRAAAQPEAAFWGITEHGPQRPHPFLPRREMPRHIQSYFLAVRQVLLVRDEFWDYWATMPPIRSYNDSVQWHESRFTEHFTSLGLQGFAVYPLEELHTIDPILSEPSALLAAGCPVVKRRVFFHDPLYTDHHGILGSQVLDDVAAAGFDTDLMLANLARTSVPRDLVTNAGLVHALVPQEAAPGEDGGRSGPSAHAVPAAPTASAGSAATAPASSTVAVQAHLTDADGVGELRACLGSVPHPYHLWVTTSPGLVPQVRRELCASVPDVTVIGVGADDAVAALIMASTTVLAGPGCDVLLCLGAFGGRDDAVQDAGAAGGTARPDRARAALAGSADLTGALLDLFARSAALGAVVPPVPHVAGSMLGHGWEDRDAARRLMEEMGLRVPLDPSTPVRPYEGVVALRPAALRRWADAVSRMPRLRTAEGAAVAAQILLYPALDDGFYCREAAGARYLARGYGLLEYKNQAVSALLPPQAMDQVPYLEARISPHASLSARIRTSMMLRWPALGDRLKPAYRLFTARMPRRPHGSSSAS